MFCVCVGDTNKLSFKSKSIKYENYLGAEEVFAALKVQGVLIQRKRCRELLSNIDPIGTATRWSRTIQRRQYRVPSANLLWHVDTHHSLIR